MSHVVVSPSLAALVRFYFLLFFPFFFLLFLLALPHDAVRAAHCRGILYIHCTFDVMPASFLKNSISKRANGLFSPFFSFFSFSFLTLFQAPPVWSSTEGTTQVEPNAVANLRC